VKNAKKAIYLNPKVVKTAAAAKTAPVPVQPGASSVLVIVCGWAGWGWGLVDWGLVGGWLDCLWMPAACGCMLLPAAACGCLLLES
jgi:hypothetical protein